MEQFGISILAGGKSSRMGEDKGLMTLFGQSMVSYVIEEVKQLNSDIRIISNNTNYNQFGFDVQKDLYPNKGPLGGICTALQHSEFDKNLILSCDIPYAKAELFHFVLKNSDGYDVCIPADEFRIHPLMGVYHKSCLRHLESQLKLDQLKILKAIEGLNLNLLNAKEFDPVYFKNINSKSDI